MSKTINVHFNDKTYTLEYTRKTVAAMERQGFEINNLTSKPATMLPLLFRGAFLAKHSSVKTETIDKIFESLRGREQLILTLTEMYHESINYLLENGDADEGNQGWEVVE